jgi:hypothetical protein
MGAEGDFPVTNIGSTETIRQQPQYDTLNTFLHPNNTLLDFLKVFIIERVKFMTTINKIPFCITGYHFQNVSVCNIASSRKSHNCDIQNG